MTNNSTFFETRSHIQIAKDSIDLVSQRAPLLLIIEPKWSIENIMMNYLVVASSVAVVGVVLAVIVAYFFGLGKTLDTFFSVESTNNRDEQTQVDSLMESEQAAKAAADAASTSDKSKTTKTTTKKIIEPRSINKEDVEHLKYLLKKYGPDDTKAWICLAWTGVYMVTVIYLLHNYPSWWSVALAGAFVVRGFIVFHDACHMSFFKSPTMNKNLSWIFSTFIPQNASDWTLSHNHHHGNLGRFDIMDFSLTVWFSKSEYESMSPLLKVAYRIIRDPFILPNLLSAHVFWLFPLIKGPLETSVNRLSFYIPLYCLLGSKTTLLYIASTWVGGIIGIQLFHLQHQCNTPYRVSPPVHSKWDAGMWGSTHLLVSWPFTLMTLGIEFHHIHHASTQVPCYNLHACHDEGASTGLWKRAGVNVIGLKRAFLSLFHTLFEDDVKFEVPGKPLPRFVAFDIYQWLGLVDSTTSDCCDDNIDGVSGINILKQNATTTVN